MIWIRNLFCVGMDMKQKNTKKKDHSAGLPASKAAVKAPYSNNENVTDSEPEYPFDFGGLPPRDLKKNLGCG